MHGRASSCCCAGSAVSRRSHKSSRALKRSANSRSARRAQCSRRPCNTPTARRLCAACAPQIDHHGPQEALREDDRAQDVEQRRELAGRPAPRRPEPGAARRRAPLACVRVPRRRAVERRAPSEGLGERGAGDVLGGGGRDRRGAAV
eukprot:4599780-Prymnesium_polylepis.1